MGEKIANAIELARTRSGLILKLIGILRVSFSVALQYFLGIPTNIIRSLESNVMNNRAKSPNCKPHTYIPLERGGEGANISTERGGV